MNYEPSKFLGTVLIVSLLIVGAIVLTGLVRSIQALPHDVAVGCGSPRSC